MPEIKETLEKITAAQKRLKPLHDRQDSDVARYKMTPFQIPAKDGKFESVTSNRAAAEADKMIEYLAYSTRKINIPLQEETVASRDKIEKTENLVQGFIYDSENRHEGNPEESAVRWLEAFYSIILGWTARRLVLYEDEDGKVICDHDVWNPRNVLWIPGHNRLPWCVLTRYLTEESAKDEFEWDGKAPESGIVTVRIEWAMDKEVPVERVIIEDKYVGEERRYPNLKELPIRIKPVGGIFYSGGDSMQVDTEAMRHLGESSYRNNRDMYDEESYLLSLEKTRAKKLAKMPVIQEYDSTKKGKPHEININPTTGGAVTPVDVGRGENIRAADLIAQGPQIQEMLVLVRSKLAEGGLAGLGLGQPPFPETATGTEIIASEIMSKMKRYLTHADRDYEWVCTQIASQFKEGDFSKVDLDGFNAKDNYFSAKGIKPEDIVTDRRFKVEHVPNILRDRSLHTNMAVLEVQSGLLSKREARDQHNLSQDPDNTEKIIAEEKAAELAGIGQWDVAFALLADAGKGTDMESQKKRLQAQLIIGELAAQQQARTAQSQSQNQPGAGNQPGEGNQPGVSPPSSPRAAVKGQRQVPSPVRDAARMRAAGVG